MPVTRQDSDSKLVPSVVTQGPVCARSHELGKDGRVNDKSLS